MILRYESPLKDDTNQHVFNLLYEHDYSIARKDILGTTHEDDDMGSWTMTVDGKPLIIDPPYIDWSRRESTNGFQCHNGVMFDTEFIRSKPNESTAEITYNYQTTDVKSFGIKMDYKNSDGEYSGNLSKQVRMYNKDDIVYYVMDDKVETEDAQDIIYRINGNGYYEGGTFSHDLSSKYAIWGYPDIDAINWKMYLHVEEVEYGQAMYPDEYHDNSLGATSTLNGLGVGVPTTDPDIAVHSRLEINKSESNLYLQSIYFPYYGVKDHHPEIVSDHNSNFVSTYIKYLGTDSLMTFHLQGGNGGITNIDITNPFNEGSSTDQLNVGGSNQLKHAMFGLSKKSEYTNALNGLSGFCKAQTNFRQAEIEGIGSLGFNHTTYISTDRAAFAGYSLQKKLTYDAFMITQDGYGFPTSVSYYIPDADIMIPMAVRPLEGDGTGFYPYYSWDSVAKVMTVNYQGSYGYKHFIIEPKNGCAVPCSYPDLQQSIIVATGNTEYLTNNWYIDNSPMGSMKLVNATKLNICDGVTLHSNGIIYLKGKTKPGESGEEPNRSEIIVSSGASLVLDSSSFTILDIDTKITVNTGGTLQLKKGAKMLIGDSIHGSYRFENGIIEIESGGSIDVDSDAVIWFHGSRDTVDRNQILINDGAYRGGGLAFCALREAFPNWSERNQDFGWCDFNKPYASFTFFPDDTLCSLDGLMMDPRRSLNEAAYRFEVCESDGSKNCISGVTQFPNGGGYYNYRAEELINLPYLYTFTPSNHYKIKLIVKNRNSCGESDSLEREFYYLAPPVANISASDTIFCPGFGTVTVDGSGSTDPEDYIWEVSEIPDSTYDEFVDIIIEKQWLGNGAPSSSFDFPEFKFVGGRSYKINLTVNNRCSSDDASLIIHVPVSAEITTNNKTVYGDGVGNNTSTLHGIVKGVPQSAGNPGFGWSPSTYLNSTTTLNPVSTPTATISYILSASNGDCIDRDTFELRFNTYANAGGNKAICKGDTVHIGSNTHCDQTWAWASSYNISSTSSCYPSVWPQKDTFYIASVNGEVDTAFVYVDSTLSPKFDRTEQKDMNVRFLNTTERLNDLCTYYWDFDDATTSTLRSPWHTYSSEGIYNVCLQVTNACGNSSICRQITIDSISRLGIDVGKIKNPSEGEEKNTVTNDENNTFKRLDLLIGNNPNPVNNNTSIFYSIQNPDPKSSTIQLINSVGSVIGTFKVDPSLNKLDLSELDLAEGIYLYTLSVNGQIVGTKKMIVIRR